ncbi:IS110 family transposase [Clostridium coskatii]|uniref:Transposase IS116/IS110/IS902 family protein n=1 Tax=Clostridium coskatii TaxID=1705578 RepID=A0A162L1B1_9CLOT|nr:IS110 family transposase [Clostridium coskatii]OAA82958.1 Transposase IS116/IS110/IS902 family protein [Clostridium coskatii]OAA85237.1 Transposase IS116/IS110/IS902 family protein [Clostridium coskatii]OBR92718.1 transposase IS116/IS110/IS902 family protein [Clostridium coskatii]
MIYIGIDVAKNKHDCCIINSDGAILNDSLRISNSRQGFEFLYSSILSILPDKDISNVKIGLESTGHYSTNLQNFLYAKGFRLSILNPLATNLFRKAQTLRKTKTDKTDALVIAKMLFSDDTKSYSPVSYQIQELKSLTRHRYRLIGYRAKLKISVNRLIDIIFPELPKLFWSIHQSSSYALLSILPNANEIAACHLTKLTNILSAASKGKYSKDKAISIKKSAVDSIGTSSRALSFELQQTIRLIQSVQVEIDALELQIKEILIEINSPLISIPGISYTLAAIILSEIGDIERFTSPCKLLAFAGLDPSTYQSGKYNASHTPMVKRGSTYLRWAVLTAARTVSMRDATFFAYLSKKRSEGKHYYVALSHVAKKLVRVIFYLLKTNTAFVPQM